MNTKQEMMKGKFGERRSVICTPLSVNGLRYKIVHDRPQTIDVDHSCPQQPWRGHGNIDDGRGFAFGENSGIEVKVYAGSKTLPDLRNCCPRHFP